MGQDEEFELMLLEDQVHIEDCTCDHEPEDHDWTHCKVPGCPCEGSWTE